MIMKMIKEVCEPCSRTINIGQPLMECDACHIAIHTKCYKSAGFLMSSNQWLCRMCSLDVTPRYNPFEKMIGTQESEKFYENDYAGEDETLQKISNVLNLCQSYTSQQLNKVIKQLQPTNNKNPTTHPPTTNPQPSSRPSQFSSYFINIDGNTTNFNTLLTELSRIDHKFSIIGIAETNTDKPLQDLYRIPGYTGFYQSTIEGKAKGTGVALYVADNFNAEVIDHLGHCTPDIESIFVRLTQPSSSQTFTCGVIYRPPSGNFKSFLDKYEHINTFLPKSGVRLIGDYNVDLLKINNSQGTGAHSQFEESFIKAGLTPVISVPTHKRENCKSSCIDNIFTSDIERVVISGCLSDQIGDHLPIFEITDINIEAQPGQEKHIQYYEFSNKNTNDFVVKLEKDLTNLTTPNDFSEFSAIFHNALDSTCKLAKPKITKRNPINNPWITDGIRAAIKRKHELKNEWDASVKKDRPSGCPDLKKAFDDYRRVLKAIINTAKHTHNCNRIIESKNDRKKTWQIINELRGKIKKVIKPSIIIDNKKILDRRVICNEFNKYFNSIASVLNDSIADTDLSSSKFTSFEAFMMPSNKNSIFLDDCSVGELLEIVSQLDNNKSSDIPIRIIKKSAHIICPYLSAYFNVCMTEGTFPDVLKVGKVTPIFKKGNLEELGNYRPVSTLPIFGKIFEKVIYNRIYNFALSQNILDRNQFGFRKSHSTSHAVNISVKIIEDSTKKKNHVLGIFIDLSKAFDTIDHSILLTKLSRYGVRGNANSLIKNYLSGRSQYTEIHGEKSDLLTIAYGVPQGSVLGPLLFLLYINDIANCSDLGIFILFADDTNIFVEGASIEEAYKKGNIVLNLVKEYMIHNKLHINMSKCCYIHFKPKTNSADNGQHQLNIDGIPIKKTSTTRFLGVIIDEKLSWEPHVAALRRKLGYASATLNRIRDSVPKELHHDLYHTLFESHLAYCISVWGDASSGITNTIFTSQKHCIRILFGDKNAYLEKFRTCARARPYSHQALTDKFFQKEHTKPLFKNHSIMAFKNLYIYHTFMEALKILKLRVPLSLYDHFSKSVRKETTLISSFPTNDFISRATTVWNTIAPKLKVLDYSHKISLAKSGLKRALLNIQQAGDMITWTDNNFDMKQISSITTKNIKVP